MERVEASRPALWCALGVAVVWPVAAASLLLDDSGFGDLSLYHEWARAGVSGEGWPVLDHPWVYPAGALLPIAALSFIPSEAGFGLTWIGLSAALDAMVVAALLRCGAAGRRAAWWWVTFLAALGAVAFTRLESLVVPIMVLAVLIVPRRPVAAAAVLTAVGWIKLVPFAWLPLLLVSTRRRRGAVAAACLAATAAILLPVAVLGGASRLLTFATPQSDRGLQIESVAALPLQVARLWGGGTDPIYTELATWELTGSVASFLAGAADLAMLPAVLLIGLLGLRALAARPDDVVSVLAWAAFALTLTLLVLNKVGSAQYVSWPAAAVVLGLVQPDRMRRREWRLPALLMLLVAALTQLIYPAFYTELVAGSPWVAAALVIRNLLLAALLIGAVRRVWVCGTTKARVEA